MEHKPPPPPSMTQPLAVTAVSRACAKTWSSFFLVQSLPKVLFHSVASDIPETSGTASPTKLYQRSVSLANDSDTDDDMDYHVRWRKGRMGKGRKGKMWVDVREVGKTDGVSRFHTGFHCRGGISLRY